MSAAPILIDFANAAVGVLPTGAMEPVMRGMGTPRLDGFTLGVWETDRPAPHGGEMHPDGEEFLFVLAGAVRISFDQDGRSESVDIREGQGCVVPRGLWHKVHPQGACRLLHLTPGPHIQVRARI